MKLSVAMCTRNGGAFVREQLESIASQEFLPDELVVCDDQSDDDTVEIVSQFAAEAPFPVRLRRNDLNLGVVRNFEQAIGLCGGEFIALSDQDDVWVPSKLRKSVQLLEDRPEVGLVCTDADIVGPDLRYVGTRMTQALGFGPADQASVAQGVALPVLVRVNFVTGTTLVIRSSLLPDVLPIPEGWIHDAWMALIVSLRSRIGFIDQPLVRYRQHAANQIGAPSRMGLGDALLPAGDASEAARRDADRWDAAVHRAVSIADPADLRFLQGKQRHARARATLSRHRLARLPVVLREVMRGNYRRYSAGAGSALKDLVAPR